MNKRTKWTLQANDLIETLKSSAAKHSGVSKSLIKVTIKPVRAKKKLVTACADDPTERPTKESRPS